MNYAVIYNGFYLNNIYIFNDLPSAKLWATSLKSLKHITDIRIKVAK